MPLVEDELPLRLMLAEFLADEGFDITEAESGDRTIGLIGEQRPFDLIFTDISLPGRTGGNDFSAIAKQRNPNTPVLYSNSRPDSLTNKIEPGDAFLSKPCRLIDISLRCAANIVDDDKTLITGLNTGDIAGSRRRAQTGLGGSAHTNRAG